MVLNKKKFVLLCSALISTSNLVYGLQVVSLNDFFYDLFGASAEPQSSESQLSTHKHSWSDIQKEIETTTPLLHEVTYLLDQMHAKNREHLTTTLAVIDKTQQQLSNLKSRLENHITTSNDFDIQEEQTTETLTITIATPGIDSKNINALVDEQDKRLIVHGTRNASGSFSYASKEYNGITGRESVINYENGRLVVSVTLPDNIEYTNHTVTFGDDEIIVTFPFQQQVPTEQPSHEHVEEIEHMQPTDVINSKENDEEEANEEESEEK